METNLNQSNLLQSLQIKQPVHQPVQPPVQQPAQQPQLPPQPVQDTFTASVPKEEKSKTVLNYIKDYSGITALVLTAAGLPVTYKLSKGKTSKQLKDLKTSVDNLAQQFTQSGIEDKIAQAVKNATADMQKRTNPISAKSALTAALVALGSVFGVKEYVKNSKEDLLKKGYSEEEINDAKDTATGILAKSENAANTANALSGLSLIHI